VTFDFSVLSSPDLGYVLAAYIVVLGGLVLYTVTLWRRLRDR